MVKPWQTSPFCEIAAAGSLSFASQVRVADCTLRDGEQQGGRGALVGQERQILFGKKSGAASIKAKLESLGIETTADQLDEVVDAVKTQAIRTKRALDDTAFARVVEPVIRS